MKRTIKIAIIGAGSATFSTRIVKDLCLCKGLYGARVTFMDIDEKRLDMIAALAARMADELKAVYTFEKTMDRARALDGADYVINSAQIGGHSYAESCRNLGTEYGYYRGTWLHYLRQMVFFAEVAGNMERLCPDAVQIMSANPVFEGCSLLHRVSSIQTIGLCHGHCDMEKVGKKLFKALGRPEPATIAGRAVGFNHWIWLSDFKVDGEDALPLLDAYIREHGDDADCAFTRAEVAQYRLYGLFPIGDTMRMAAWWMHVDFPTKQHWFGETGGMDSHVGWAKHLAWTDSEIQKIERAASNPDARVSDLYPPVQSHEQIVPILDSMENNVQALYQVNIPNQGQILKGIGEDIVVECQAMIDGFGVHPISEPPFPKGLMVKAMLPRYAFAESMIEAVRQRDKDILLFHILSDHRTRTYEQAKEYLEAWLAMPGNEQMRGYFGG